METPTTKASAEKTALKLTDAALGRLEARCAPEVPTSVISSIVRAESGLRPLLIHENHPVARTYSPASAAEASHIIDDLVQARADFDVGLAQINSQNLPALGVTAADMLDPCRNLASARRIMEVSYARALQQSGPGRSVLETAYSFYNTGRAEFGFRNGYSERVRSLSQVHVQ